MDAHVSRSRLKINFISAASLLFALLVLLMPPASRARERWTDARSEEHTSELQSP